MRIALDVSAAPARLAGAGRYMLELSQQLESVSDLSLVTRRDDSKRWRESVATAQVVDVVPTARAARLAYERWRLGTTPLARHVDVWHSPHYTMPHRGLTPTVVTIHDMTFFTNPEWHERAKVTFFRSAITYAATHARALVCVSEFTANHLREQLAVAAPIYVAPHGVDHWRFRPDGDGDVALGRRYGLDLSRPYILFVGTLEPRKGVDVLLEAFTEIARTHATVDLWLVGQPGWGMDAVYEQLRTHPATQRIHQLGFVDDELLPALLRQSRVVAYPSRGEGFGLPVLEALACGATVVTTRHTVMEEVAGGVARLVDVGSSSQLVTALREALDETLSDRHRLSLRAQQRAAEFTWARSTSIHLEAYSAALA